MFNRNWNVCLETQGAVSFDTKFPDGEPELELEAWQGGEPTGGEASVWLFEGALSTSDCAQRIGAVNGPGGRIDAIMVIPAGGRGTARIPPDVTSLTVYTNVSPINPPLGVTIRCRQVG